MLRSLPVVGGDVESAITEYNLLVKTDWKTTNNDPASFWAEIIDDDLNNGIVPRFNNICMYATCVLSLPFSNASVERAFSVVNIVKTKLRNRLFVKTVDSILRVRYLLRWKNVDCRSFLPSDSMLKLFKLQMYERECDICVVTDEESVETALAAVEGAFNDVEPSMNLQCINLV